jgi:hypothetical protein
MGGVSLTFCTGWPPTTILLICLPCNWDEKLEPLHLTAGFFPLKIPNNNYKYLCMGVSVTTIISVAGFWIISVFTY